MSEVLELIAVILVFIGSVFCLSAAVGVIRFPDVITRLHAAAKPQVFGLIVILVGVVVAIPTWQVAALCVLVAIFQVVTNPVAAQMVSRTAYRTGLWDAEHAVVDELGEDLQAAGYFHPDEETAPPASGRG